METKFPKLPFGPRDIPRWIVYFNAGSQWLRAYEIVRDAKEPPTYAWLYYVEPHALYFAVELFIKSIASEADSTFNARADKSLGHSATAIIEKYRSIPRFANIIQDGKLLSLIKTYEDTLWTRFGETTVSMDGDDTNLLFELANQLWNDIDSERRNGPTNS